jgi:spore coat polysaccharide biosynthesis protein SpsF
MKNQKIIALIQARMGSSRLPGKILMDLEGQPVIWHIWQRLKNVSKIDEVVVATSTDSSNKILIENLKKYNIKYFRGSEDNVLDRFYDAATLMDTDYVIRVTADCPLIDPYWVSKAIKAILKDVSLDYLGLPTGAGVMNEKINKLPDGLDTEIFKYTALKKAWKEAKDPLDRGEAVTSYIWRNKDKFKTGSIYPDKNYGHLRWTLDTEDDFKFISEVYRKLYPIKSNFDFNDILKILERNPELLKINSSGFAQVKYAEYYDIKEEK